MKCETCGKKMKLRKCWLCGKIIDSDDRSITIKQNKKSTPDKEIHSNCWWYYGTCMKRERRDRMSRRERLNF